MQEDKKGVFNICVMQAINLGLAKAGFCENDGACHKGLCNMSSFSNDSLI